MKVDIPIREEAIDRFNQVKAQIEDLLNESSEILGFAARGKVLLTREEVAKILRCDPKKVPRQIPNARIGRNWLYEQSDVYAFIDSKKRLNKKTEV